jgi:hypothetical protein
MPSDTQREIVSVPHYQGADTGCLSLCNLTKRVPLEIPDGFNSGVSTTGNGEATGRHATSTKHHRFDSSSERGRILESLIESIYQTDKKSPEDGPVTCQACAQPLQDGNTCTAHAVRASAHAPWVVTHSRCDCGDQPLSLANRTTQGVEERLLTGRRARVADHTTQQDWAVVIGGVREHSSAETTTAVPVPITPTPHTETQEGWA